MSRIKNFLTSDDRAKGLLGRLLKINTVWGDEKVGDTLIVGGEEINDPTYIRTPLLTTMRILPRRYIHIFWRADADPDWHDHMWDFWTFPLWPKSGYVEDVLLVDAPFRPFVLQRVKGWKWHFRKAEHSHRVVAPGTIRSSVYGDRLDASDFAEEHIRRGTITGWPVITYVVKGPKRRSWGFWVHRDGKWAYRGWQDYVFWDGKTRPLEDNECL